MPSDSLDRLVTWLASPTGLVPAAFVLLLVVAAGLLGFGSIAFVPLWIGYVVVGLWLLSRFVVAVERIAGAQERLVAASVASEESGTPAEELRPSADA